MFRDLQFDWQPFGLRVPHSFIRQLKAGDDFRLHWVYVPLIIIGYNRVHALTWSDRMFQQRLFRHHMEYAFGIVASILVEWLRLQILAAQMILFITSLFKYTARLECLLYFLCKVFFFCWKLYLQLFDCTVLDWFGKGLLRGRWHMNLCQVFFVKWAERTVIIRQLLLGFRNHDMFFEAFHAWQCFIDRKLLLAVSADNPIDIFWQ